MGMGGQWHALAALPQGQTHYPLYRRLGGPQSQSGRVQKILPPTRIQSPNRAARSKSLYWLHYPGPSNSHNNGTKTWWCSCVLNNFPTMPLWDGAQCSPNTQVPVFEETCWLHFPQHPENGGSRFLKIICTFIPVYLTTQHHIPEDRNLEFTTYTYLIFSFNETGRKNNCYGGGRYSPCDIALVRRAAITVHCTGTFQQQFTITQPTEALDILSLLSWVKIYTASYTNMLFNSWRWSSLWVCHIESTKR